MSNDNLDGHYTDYPAQQPGDNIDCNHCLSDHQAKRCCPDHCPFCDAERTSKRQLRMLGDCQFDGSGSV